MTGEEFRNLFNVLFNNITSNQAPGLDDYEICVFLTKGLNELMKNYFLAQSNPKLAGFDDNQKRLYDFSSLIETKVLSNVSVPTKLNHNSITYEWPSDILYSLNEEIVCNNTSYTIMPISFTEYATLMKKPYKYPPKHIVWRLNSKTKYHTSTPSTEIAYIPINGQLVPFTTISSYNKPIRVIVILKTGTEESQEPIIEETASLIKITMIASADDFPSGATFTLYLDEFDGRNILDDYFDFVDDYSTEGMFFDEVPITDLTLVSDGVNPIINIVNDGGTLTNTTASVVELIGRMPSPRTYTIRYVRKPLPIIISSLKDLNLSIDGYNGTTTDKIEGGVTVSKGNSFYSNGKCCELPEEMHEEILQRAVELAKIAWLGDVQSNMLAGQRSE